MRFRLRPGSGAHVQKGPDGKSRLYKPDDVVESPTDLAARFGAGKFERLPDLAPPRPEPAPVTAAAPLVADDDLEAQSVADLRTLASLEEIDVRGATRKEDLVRLIRAARADD